MSIRGVGGTVIVWVVNKIFTYHRRGGQAEKSVLIKGEVEIRNLINNEGPNLRLRLPLFGGFGTAYPMDLNLLIHQ